MRSSILAIITLAVLSQSTCARPVGGEVDEDPISVAVDYTTDSIGFDPSGLAQAGSSETTIHDYQSANGGYESTTGSGATIAGNVINESGSIPVLGTTPLSVPEVVQAANNALGALGL